MLLNHTLHAWHSREANAIKIVPLFLYPCAPEICARLEMIAIISFEPRPICPLCHDLAGCNWASRLCSSQRSVEPLGSLERLLQVVRRRLAEARPGVSRSGGDRAAVRGQRRGSQEVQRPAVSRWVKGLITGLSGTAVIICARWTTCLITSEELRVALWRAVGVSASHAPHEHTHALLGITCNVKM